METFCVAIIIAFQCNGLFYFINSRNLRRIMVLKAKVSQMVKARKLELPDTPDTRYIYVYFSHGCDITLFIT